MYLVRTLMSRLPKSAQFNSTMKPPAAPGAGGRGAGPGRPGAGGGRRGARVYRLPPSAARL
jgi:hypothetical protein